MSTHERDCRTERWHDELAAYALGSLSSEESFEVECHLDECAHCRGRVEWLRPAVDVLPASVDQLEPPASLRKGLMGAVRADAERRPSGFMRRLGLFSLRPVLVAVATASVIVAGAVGYLVAGPGTDSQTVAVESLAPRQDIGGELEVDGDKGVLTLTGLPLIARDEVYQTWLDPEDGGDVVPSTVFVRDAKRSGHAVIEGGIENADRVMVTREAAYAGKPPREPSTNPLASAQIP